MILFFYLCVTVTEQGDIREERRHIGVTSLVDAYDLISGWNQWTLTYTKDMGTFFIPDVSHSPLKIDDSTADSLIHQVAHGIDYYLLPIRGKVG